MTRSIFKYNKLNRLAGILILLVLFISCNTAIAQNINTLNKMGPLGTQVNTYTGNLYIPRNDFSITARGFNMQVSFSYNSFNFDHNEGFGNGWDFLNIVRYKNDTSNSRTIIWGDGREDTYSYQGSTSYKSPKGFFNSFSQYQNNKYLLTEKDGTKYYFDNSIHKKITRLEEPNGNYISFSYTDSLMTSMTNNSGQLITFTYNTSGRLASIIDGNNAPTRTWIFTYDNNGNLAQVADPLGGTNKYAYLINGPMKSLTDKNNNTVDIIYYNNFSVSELVGCNKRQSFSYDTSSKISVVTDYMSTGGNQITNYAYKVTGNLVWLKTVTSNCCGFNMNFEYDDNGNKLKETDARGIITTYTYDTKGNMLSMTDGLNQTIFYTYSPDFNKITSYTDAKGYKTTLVYNNTGNLVQLIEPGNLVYNATYNSNGDLITSSDPKGNTFSYNYDLYGHRTTVSGPAGYHIILNSNARGNLLSYTDPRGNLTTMEYDILDKLKKITDPINNNLQFSYDAEGNTTLVKNQNSENTLLKYDASNRIVQFTDAMNNKAFLSYDAMDNITSIKNALGNAWSFTYDTRNRLNSIIDALGNIKNINYDASGNISSMILPNGESISYSYDQLNRLTTITDNTGTIASVIYDRNDNVISYTNVTGTTTTALYDSVNRIKQIIDPQGYPTQLTYDNNSNISTVTDRIGFNKVYTYDSLNRVTSYTDNNGAIITVSRNGVGNILSIKDQNNNSTTYSYDSLNRVKTTTYLDGKYMQYSYDNKGNTLVKRMPDGTNITYIYDSLNRVISKTLAGGIVYTYTYDALGRMKTATNNAGTILVSYDELNRVVSETFDGRTTRYNYNISGRSQTTIYPDSTTITKIFNTRNKLLSIAKGNTNIVSYQYDNGNRVIAKNFANGVATNLQYDFANRLSNISTSNIQNTTYQYDKEGNKKAINRLNNPSLSEQFTYDNEYRVTNYKRGIIGSPSIQNIYTYDPLGNRTTANLNGTTTNYTSNNLNQLTSSNNGAQTINYTYDNNGNLSYDGIFYKTYDVEGKLLQDSSAPSNILTYKYDALGRRVQKIYNGQPYKYTYSGLLQIEEREGISNNLRTRTIFKDFLTPVLNEKGINSYYYHQNELNSVEAITGTTGGLTERYQYDIYGKQTIYDSANNIILSSIAGNRFGFTGQEYDSANGENHFFYRNYSSQTGKFDQRDLLGYGDGMGMYQYVHDNPANGIDIFGLDDHCKTETSQKESHHTTSTTHHEAHDPVETVVHNAHTISEVPHLLEEFIAETPMAWAQGVSTIAGALVGTMNTAKLINNVQAGKGSNGQNADLATGAITAYEGASLPLLVVGGAVTAAEAAPVAVGLASYGIVNGATKLITGQSLSERAEEIPNPPVEWLYSGYKYNGLPIERTDNNMSWQVNSRAKKIRDEIETGEFFVNKRKTMNNPNCPQNQDPHGTQKPPPYPPGFVGPRVPVAFTLSGDPNLIIGPDGQPSKHWVSVNDRLPYTILFENSKSASAPAKFVRITSPIEPKEDASSFQLGSFGFNNQTFSVAPGTPSYYQRLDCRDSIGLYVDVTAGYDQIGNVAFWEFQSIDPVTLLPPPDPLKGFLLLQDSLHPNYGHAFVNFSMKPITTALTLDTIGARAKIIFDTNDTIPTNIAKNTIDAFPPTSHMVPLPAMSPNPVHLFWSGTDDAGGSGLKSYTLYASTDGVNFSIIRSGITRTDTTLTLTPNSNFCFFVLATDSVGNMEALRAGETRCTMTSSSPLPISSLYFVGSNHDKTNLLEWSTTSEQNSKEFKLERSLTGSGFTEIATLPAAGNSTSLRNYMYSDNNIDRLNSNVFYYRLKAVDLNSAFKYSSVVRLRYSSKGTLPSIVYPNPTNGLINITIGDKLLIGTNAILVDVNGKKLQQFKIKSETQPIDLSRYANGVYFIHLSNNEMMRIVKD